MKPLVGLVALVGAALALFYFYARYDTLSACTDLENRLDEAARPPASQTPVSEASVRDKVAEIASAVGVSVEQTTVSMEPLTPENAGTISSVVGKAVGIAGQLPNHKIAGQVLNVTVTGTAHGFLYTRRCDMNRRLFVPSG